MPGGLVTVHAQGVEAAARYPATCSRRRPTSAMPAPSILRLLAESSAIWNIYSPAVSSSAERVGTCDGNWVDHEQVAVLKSAGGKIVFRFHARDLHLVLGPTADGKPVRFRVTIDGQAPGENHGVDTDAQGQRRRNGISACINWCGKQGTSQDHIFTIEFQDPGVQAFAFTFG